MSGTQQIGILRTKNKSNNHTLFTVTDMWHSSLLSQDLESWLTGADSRGAIYFSLGSVLHGQTMIQKYLPFFVEAFSRLPQRILWKYEGELQGASDNIRVSSWLPQQDILGKSATTSLRWNIACLPELRTLLLQGTLAQLPDILLRKIKSYNEPARNFNASYNLFINWLNTCTNTYIA